MNASVHYLTSRPPAAFLPKHTFKLLRLTSKFVQYYLPLMVSARPMSEFNVFVCQRIQNVCDLETLDAFETPSTVPLLPRGLGYAISNDMIFGAIRRCNIMIWQPIHDCVRAECLQVGEWMYPLRVTLIWLEINVCVLCDLGHTHKQTFIHIHSLKYKYTYSIQHKKKNQTESERFVYQLQ